MGTSRFLSGLRAIRQKSRLASATEQWRASQRQVESALARKDRRGQHAALVRVRESATELLRLETGR